MSHDSADTIMQGPRLWIMASLVFALFVGTALSIPLVYGVSLKPDGYRTVPSVREGAAETVIVNNRHRPCDDCAGRREGVPVEIPTFIIDQPVGIRGPAAQAV